MKRVLLVVCICVGVLQLRVAAQTSGIYESYAILSVNGGANKFYDMNAATGNTDFEGNYLGDFFPGGSLVVKGGQNKIFKCGTCDIFNGFLQYRVYLTSGGPSGAFTGIGMGFVSNDPGAPPGCTNQTWQGTSGVANLITALSTPGNYTLEVYATADYQFCGSGTNFSNNGGANYKANFNYCSTTTLHASAALDCDTRVIPDYGNTFAVNCGIIGRMVPQGGSAVFGQVQACAYRYATAQRHPGANTVYAPRVVRFTPVTNPTTSTSRITLYYTQADLDAYDTELGYDAMPDGPADVNLATKKAFMVFTQYQNNVSFGSFTDGGSFINPNDADIVWNSTNNWWEISFDNTGSGEYYLHTGTSILNRQPIFFTGDVLDAQTNRLTWKLPCDAKLAAVALEKLTAGGVWKVLHQASVSVADCDQHKQILDADLQQPVEYYRLRMTTIGNEVLYSDIAKLENRERLQVIRISPNPVQDWAQVRYHALKAGTSQLQLHDLKGQVLLRQQVMLKKGLNQFNLPTASLQAGMYIIRIDGASFVFIKQ
jgi:hypothetical protein